MEKLIVSVDVGGTFCDCLLNKAGILSSFKLLSSGKLRAKVTKSINQSSVEIEQQWSLPYPEVIHGCFIKSLISNRKVTIKSFDPSTQVIKMNASLPLKPGDLVEIYMDAEVVVFATHLITGIPLDQRLDQVELRVGTTKGTNALLESKGQHCVWITNLGFKDLLYIKTQQRPNLFQLNIPEPIQYQKQVIELKARMNASGKIIKAWGKEDRQRILDKLPADRSTPIAVSLIHSYKNPEHELKIKNLLTEQGFRFLSISHELNPTIHLLPRSETTVANAYLSPIIEQFKESISKYIPANQFYFISSAGQLIPAKDFNAKDSLLSGPAGGIKGAEYLGKKFGIGQLITFDMGGTSTDTARIDGKADVRFNLQIGAINLSTPAYYMETVAAGGGSIIDFDEGRFKVGPSSAGADPGPACYGKMGPLTLTDINLLQGKLIPEAFSIPIDPIASELKFNEILVKAGIRASKANRKKVLEGIESIANEIMAAAIRKISFSKGFDPSVYTLLSFGGAGGLHACALAGMLQMKKIIIPFEAGIFSAMGISKTARELMPMRQINELLEACEQKLPKWFDLLRSVAQKKFIQSGIPVKKTKLKSRQIYLRYKGQDQVIELEWSPQIDLIQDFKEKYFLIYQTEFDFPIEVEKILINLQADQDIDKQETILSQESQVPATAKTLTVTSVRWDTLLPAQTIQGPCTVYHKQASCYIREDWKALVNPNQDLILVPTKKREITQPHTPAIELELFNNRFKSIAEQMGAQLQFSAFSVNVKERLDFSCALLDHEARLLVNAPHIPVHLGSLGLAARLILDEFTLKEGDIILCNHPQYGGSHLPDLTLLKAVFDRQKKLIGYVINRAHHAEIGGMTPGSMPAFATNLEQEGVIFRPTYIYKRGKPQWKRITQLLLGAKYPSRKPELNILDLKAGISALLTGEKQLKQLASNYGTAYLQKQMQKIFHQSHSLIERFRKKHQGKSYQATEQLDDGKNIQVKIAVRKKYIAFDFSGTSSQHPGNLNANPSIVQSVLLYILRLLCNRDITLNEGLMSNIKNFQPNSFIHPTFNCDDRLSPAVVGGNTEVSQRLTDTLIKAFELSACGQGTMNNFLFGNDRYSYYETIGGGAGAGPGFNGRSAIHQHMTNTKITDPEELELRYPVLLKEFSIRSGSGGKGKFTGGHGITRVIQFLEAMTVTILAQHRLVAPYGLQGGQAGSCGTQYLLRKGKKIKLTASESFEVVPGDELSIHTPGGGGWGRRAEGGGQRAEGKGRGEFNNPMIRIHNPMIRINTSTWNGVTDSSTVQL